MTGAHGDCYCPECAGDLMAEVRELEDVVNRQRHAICELHKVAGEYVPSEWMEKWRAAFPDALGMSQYLGREA